MKKPIPPLLLQKIEAFAAHYGLDQLPDGLLIRIARTKVPNVSDRVRAMVIVMRYKLPIPVYKPAPVDCPKKEA